MNLLRLSADESLARLDQSGEPPKIRSLASCLAIGSVGFCLVSLLVFGIWAFAGRPLTQAYGEGGFYAVLAAAFMALSGVVFERLLIVRGAMGRFYALFIAGFFLYAAWWCAAWFLLKTPLGARGAGLVGAAGTMVMAAVFCAGFKHWRVWGVNALVLFVANALGYFLGDLMAVWFWGDAGAGILENILSPRTRKILGALAWGLGYGLGFGFGIGHNLYTLQTPLRERLAARGAL